MSVARLATTALVFQRRPRNVRVGGGQFADVHYRSDLRGYERLADPATNRGRYVVFVLC